MGNNKNGYDKLRVMMGTAFTAALMFLLLLAFQSCAKKSNGMYGRQSAAPVIAATAVTKTVPIQVSTIGNVEAYSTVSVTAQAGGELKQVYFKEGQSVEKGDKLFLIDPRPYEAALEQAKADLLRDRAQYENAEQDVHRYEGLVTKDYVTREQYEQIQTNAEALSATVMADDAAVRNAQLQLGYCSIDAPISGRTGDLLIKTGNIVKANDTNPLVTIQQIKPVYVSFSLPEQYVSDIREYSQHRKLRVSVVPSSAPAAGPVTGSTNAPLTGVLTFMNNTVDTTTGTILLKGTFQNGKELLWPGESVNVTLTLTERHDAVVVPTPAVQTGQSGQYVFVIKADHTVDIRPVSVHYSYDGESIVDSGLAAGEQVVTDGQMSIVSGSHVTIQDGHGAPGKTAQ